MIGWFVSIFVLAGCVIASGLKVVNQYERGVKFTLGKFSGILEPGLNIVIPVIETWYRIDMRVIVIDVPPQDTITKDNVTVKVNAVLYYRVIDAAKAVLQVEQYNYAVSQLAQTTMRNVIGAVELDQLLSRREEISSRIQQQVTQHTETWGILVQNVELKQIDLPDTMIRTMAKQAEAEREKRAVVLNAEGDLLASQNLAKAAEILSSTPGGMHLRTLHCINDASSDESNTIIFALPIEVLRALDSLTEKKKEKK